MNITQRLDHLESAIAGRLQPEPNRRWDFNGFTTDHLLRVRELLRRNPASWSTDDARLVRESFSREITVETAPDKREQNQTEDHHG